jgi:hypothetical protein
MPKRDLKGTIMSKRNNKGSNPQPTPKNEEKQTVRQERPAQIDNGEDARSGPTERSNQTSTQPEPLGMGAIGSEDTAAKVAQLRPIGSRTNVFHAIATDISHRAAEKMQHLGEARQRLAEAKDLADKGEEFADEAKGAAAKAIAVLYQARVNGELSADEVSAALGDTFGYKPKRDGKPGKTPAGLGEPIRKRVVRLVQAAQFATADEEEDVSTFFRGMDKGAVAQVLNEVHNGNATGWQAYDRFAEMKREGSNARVNPAFDAKRIVAMASALTEAEAIDKLIDEPAVWEAYATLSNVLRVIGENDRLVAAYEKAKAKAA